MKSTPLPDLFVSPTICSVLHAKGITSKVPFTYHIYENGKHFIISEDFDYMDLYSHKHIDVPGVHTEYRRVPAYTIADMLALMPDFELSKEGKTFQVQCHGANGFGVSAVAERYADAAALCVKKMIDQNQLSAHPINLKLQY